MDCDKLLTAAKEVVEQYDGLAKRFSSMSRFIPGVKNLDDGPIERLREAVRDNTTT